MSRRVSPSDSLLLRPMTTTQTTTRQPSPSEHIAFCWLHLIAADAGCHSLLARGAPSGSPSGTGYCCMIRTALIARRRRLRTTGCGTTACRQKAFVDSALRLLRRVVKSETPMSVPRPRAVKSETPPSVTNVRRGQRGEATTEDDKSEPVAVPSCLSPTPRISPPRHRAPGGVKSVDYISARV